jgi:short chain dehydrogenase.
LSDLRATGVAVTTKAVDAKDGRAVSELIKRYADRLDLLVYNAAALRLGTVNRLFRRTLNSKRGINDSASHDRIVDVDKDVIKLRY